MSDAAGAFDPAQLDTFRPATVDPRVWTANLTALATDEPEFAEALRRLELPASWRPAVALDDSLTYRLEEAGQPPTWLGNTAAPRARAASLLERYDHSGRNPALPTCAAGAELRYLLDRLPQHLTCASKPTHAR